MGRNTQGVRVINTNEGEKVVAIEHLAEKDEEEGGSDSAASSAPAAPQDPNALH
jgi:hypothetical protein